MTMAITTYLPFIVVGFLSMVYTVGHSGRQASCFLPTANALYSLVSRRIAQPFSCSVILPRMMVYLQGETPKYIRVFISAGPRILVSRGTTSEQNASTTVGTAQATAAAP